MNAATSRTPNPVLATLGRLLESALDRALALDPATQAKLAALEGRRIGVTLRGIGLALALTVHGGRLEVGPHWQHAADLDLRATPGSLLAFALRREDSALPPGKVDIAGDAELARQVEKLLRDFRPDVEEAFARSFGDVLGVPIARGLRRALAYAADSAHALAKDGAEFLRDERRDLVAPAEMEQFLDDVDALRERADRLDARLARLAQALRTRSA
ncbi:MAG TPA: SCP2 sterol-binding domain-containing protein [Rudaea sp.]|nr:SCP2 sterol-binding domain-containing protein [Rudaea sp.]